MTKKKHSNKFIIYSILIIVLSNALLVGLGLLWQKNTSLESLANAFFLSAFIQFGIGWMVLMVNMNILSGLTYGIKSFFSIIVGKKPKQNYYQYSEDKKNNPIPKYFIFVPLISSIPSFITSIIMYVIIF